MKALIIDEPWISRILDGSKTWEMRSRMTTARGPIALIRKGSGAVVGVAQLTGCRGPLILSELEANLDRHRVPIDRYRAGAASRWTTAWELAQARPLEQPVPYRHPFGAVTWVNLDSGTVAAILAQNQDRPVHILAASSRPDDGAGLHGFCVDPAMRVPVAKDGTWFGPHLMRAGQFTIGEKGEEVRVDSFTEAMERLRQMKSPRWRRPNASGNWGIVTGIKWVALRTVQAVRAN